MNDARRRRIRKLTSDLYEGIQQLLGEYAGDLQEICDEEQEAFDNLPEGIQCSDRGDAMQECIEALESAVNSCEDADMNYVFDDIQSMLETCEAEL